MTHFEILAEILIASDIPDDAEDRIAALDLATAREDDLDLWILKLGNMTMQQLEHVVTDRIVVQKAVNLLQMAHVVAGLSADQCAILYRAHYSRVHCRDELYLRMLVQQMHNHGVADGREMQNTYRQHQQCAIL